MSPGTFVEGGGTCRGIRGQVPGKEVHRERANGMGQRQQDAGNFELDLK